MKINVRFRLLSPLVLPLVLLTLLSGTARAAPSLAGVSDRYRQARDWGQVVATARQTLAVAANPEERTQAAEALGQALLSQSDEKSWAEAADLFRGEVASSGGAQGVRGLFTALFALHRDTEAAELLRSLRKEGRSEDDIQHLLCSVGTGGPPSDKPDEDPRIDDRNGFLRKLEPTAPLRVGGKVKRPEIRSKVKPEMTAEARRNLGVRYRVIVETIIDTQGQVRSIKVLKGEPMALTESAVNAVRQWTFSPATLDGAPVPVCYVLTVNFQAG
jgi:TonB family protein